MLTKIKRSADGLIHRFKTRMKMHPSIRRYMAFCRRTWPLDYPRSEDSVVLVGLFHWNASVHCYAHLTNYVARKTGSTIEWFYLHGRRNYVYERIFAAFGAGRGLCAGDLGIDEQEARKRSDEIAEALQTKWDVINIAIDGIDVGDLIYDTFLRGRSETTLDPKDPALRGIIHQAVRFTMAAQNYFARKKVVAAIVDHTLYLQAGLICRLACCAGIPVYQAYYGEEFYVVRVENDREISDVPVRLPCARYRELFAQLALDEKVRALERGRTALEERLAGKVDGVLFTSSAYGSERAEPVLRPGTKPRILILLHEFCDTVHCYRRMLFPDFYEWTHYIMRVAEQTSFEWYAKPHPAILMFDEMGREQQGEVNRRVVAELKEKYPHIHFLDPRISNRQIIAEGIAAMFTVHGTAGHEFAYLGVPVVNAGDNPHAAYSFNVHPKTLEEYEHCIRHADALDLKIRREEIEEYFYMNYLYFSEHRRAEGNPIPAAYFQSEYYRQNYAGNQPESFDLFAEPLPVEETKALERYFDRVVAPTLVKETVR